jgi:putative membrane-bound dehydrogenase-like protein
MRRDRRLGWGIVALMLLAADGTRADQAPTPADERAAMRLADPALDVALVASEPAVASPVAVAWDEFGRLYVVEMTDYPLSPDGGRVKRLEDRDGDGRYEHVTVFADKLHWPSGVLPWNGGVLVTAAPDLIYFKDTDGDGRADGRRVVLTGFGEGNQQLRVNSPTWGLDNGVYLANGRSGGAVRRPDDPPGKAVPIPRNDLRVDPATGSFTVVAGFSQFGLPRDDWGDRFPSWNIVPIRHVVLEPADPAPDPRTVAEILDLGDGGRVYSLAPAQKRFNAETVAFFNATCGPTIYRAGLLGESYRGHAFVCEPLTSLIHHRRLDVDGPTYMARRVDSEKNREFLASTHPWFRPVNLTTGPDGALYIADFCRAWVEHPAFVPEGQRSSVDFREGFNHGRIWRVAPRGAKVTKAAPWPGTLDTAGLVALLADPNGWRRDTAQRLLVERHDLKAVDVLRKLAAGSPSALGRVHALWTLQGLGALDATTVTAALRDRDPRVREQAARVALAAGLQGALAGPLAAMAGDDSARVRLRAAVALGRVDPRNEATCEALARIAARDAESPWTAAAVLNAVAPSPGSFLDTLATRQPAWLSNPTPAQADFLARLGELIGSTGPQDPITAALDRAVYAKAEVATFALLRGLVAGVARTVDRPAGLPKSDVFKAETIRALDRAVTAAVASARDAKRPEWIRSRAFALLLVMKNPITKTLIPDLLEASQPAPLQTAAARGVAVVGDAALVDALLARWDTFTLATRRVLLGVLSGSDALAARLVEAVAGGGLAASELDPGTRDALRRVTSPALRARIAAVLPAPPGADRRDVLRRYEPALAASAEPARGRDLFAKHCQTCHARGGQGAKVGPDLLSVAGKAPADLLVAILDPSREVAPDSVAVVVATTRGQTLTGLLVEETPASLRLRRAEGLEDVVPRADVEALRSTGRSLMPDGLEQVLRPQDVADLIAFLKSAPGP